MGGRLFSGRRTVRSSLYPKQLFVNTMDDDMVKKTQTSKYCSDLRDNVECIYSTLPIDYRIVNAIPKSYLILVKQLTVRQPFCSRFHGNFNFWAAWAGCNCYTQFIVLMFWCFYSIVVFIVGLDFLVIICSIFFNNSTVVDYVLCKLNAANRFCCVWVQ